MRIRIYLEELFIANLLIQNNFIIQKNKTDSTIYLKIVRLSCLTSAGTGNRVHYDNARSHVSIMT